jgi:hypothetical protein
MLELSIPDSVKQSADLQTFVCIEGTEEQRAFCAFFIAASAKMSLNAKQFLSTCGGLREMIVAGILIDEEALPALYNSPLREKLEAMEAMMMFRIDRQIVIAMACFCFDIDNDHQFIAELNEAMDSEWARLMMQTLMGPDVKVSIV